MTKPEKRKTCKTGKGQMVLKGKKERFAGED